jgi:hypothetical protein
MIIDQKVGLPFPEVAADTHYDDFLGKTAKYPADKRKREILEMTRKTDGSKEFILWNESLIAFDGLGNELHHFKSLEKFPIPVPQYELRQIEGTLETAKSHSN